MESATRVIRFGHYARDIRAEESRRKEAEGTQSGFVPGITYRPARLYLCGNTSVDRDVVTALMDESFMKAFMDRLGT